MRIAAIYDIHGNLPALEAVLNEVRKADVSAVVVGGDVLPGPMPLETLDCLLHLEIPAKFIFGNGEIAVLEAMAGRMPAAVPEPYLPIIHWTARRVAEHEGCLRSWPKTVSMALPNFGAVLFCHGTPRDENECFTRLTPEASLLPVFEGLNARVVVCGHTHMQFDRTIGATRVVNAGSVGMPFGQPGADWLLLNDTRIELRHTSYDLQQAAERIQQTDYPGAQDHAMRYVLATPSEQQMLDVFTHVHFK